MERFKGLKLGLKTIGCIIFQKRLVANRYLYKSTNSLFIRCYLLTTILLMLKWREMRCSEKKPQGRAYTSNDKNKHSHTIYLNY